MLRLIFSHICTSEMPIFIKYIPKQNIPITTTAEHFNNPIKIYVYEMSKTEIDDPMRGCETCRKTFRDHTLSFRKNYIPTQKINIQSATDKSTKRINNILHNIEKMKKGSARKYQIRGYYEYKQKNFTSTCKK